MRSPTISIVNLCTGAVTSQIADRFARTQGSAISQIVKHSGYCNTKTQKCRVCPVRCEKPSADLTEHTEGLILAVNHPARSYWILGRNTLMLPAAPAASRHAAFEGNAPADGADSIGVCSGHNTLSANRIKTRRRNCNALTQSDKVQTSGNCSDSNCFYDAGPGRPSATATRREECMTRIANLDRIPDCTNCIIFSRSLVIAQPALQRSVYRRTHNGGGNGRDGSDLWLWGARRRGPPRLVWLSRNCVVIVTAIAANLLY